jgi:hypothetical protein
VRLALLSFALGLAATGCRERTFVVGVERDAGGGVVVDAGRPPDAGLEACAGAVAPAVTGLAPVDIVWVIDNSASMEDVIREVQSGLDDFADAVAANGLDVRVIVLSLRGEGEATVNGGTRFLVCIDDALAGPDCADAPPLFYQVDIDIRSTQALEQFLGTLGQTGVYADESSEFSARAPTSPPGGWRQYLREDSTKTIVVATDHFQRHVVRSGDGFVAGPNRGQEESAAVAASTADWFETRPAGINEFTASRGQLPPGILDPFWGGLFEGYTFNGIYGFGDDPDGRCGDVPGAGLAFDVLVERTGGVRAQICDAASSWGPFIEEVANRVVERARVACEVDLPEPPEGESLSVDRVNVLVGPEQTLTGRVGSAGECGEDGGWYYDDPTSPTQVILCPASCDLAQELVEEGASSVNVQFGCATFLI